MDYRTVPSVCIYCGCGCGMLLEVLDGMPVGLLAEKGHPVNDGRLCIKGWNALEHATHAERLTSPLIKGKDGSFRKASWDEALDLVAGRLSEIRKESGPDSLAVLTSAKCTNEENYVLMKFARAVLGTNNVDHCARL